MRKLGEISQKITKGTTPTTLGYHFISSGINFIKVETINENGGFILDKMAFISQECYKKLERSQLQENDILFSIAGALGRVAIVNKQILPANTNQALAIIRLENNLNNINFIKIVLQIPSIETQINEYKKGIAQQNLSLEQIENLQIPLPPLQLQERIINAIERIESNINFIDSSLKMIENKKEEILNSALKA